MTERLAQIIACAFYVACVLVISLATIAWFFNFESIGHLLTGVAP